MRPWRATAAAAVLLAGSGCGRSAGSAGQPAPQPLPLPIPSLAGTANTGGRPKTEPVIPPQVAFLAGLMPLRSIGADTFRSRHPPYDGRGVLIAILDGGLDPGLPGLQSTTTGQAKLVDLRDFSAEGRIDLVPVTPRADGGVVIGPFRLMGFGRVGRLAGPPYWGGVFRELPLGRMPAADVNGNGRNTDEFPVIVARSSGGWFAMTDSDGDGTLEDEIPLYDYAVSPATFTYGGTTGARVLTLAVNLAERGGVPELDFFFDNSGHGSHVAGIAAGHDLFGIHGFDGVAPGTQLLSLKIANNARGGISVTGSILRAMNYAADFAERRGLPLVLNLSYGVGNEREGGAAIDSLVDEFTLKHPGVLFVISAGNDGPGLSTVGSPGSAELALTACALFPGAFATAPDEDNPPPPDALGSWSARGGELAKPDVCAPGVAFSNVPPWRTGEEISAGTSMAAPQVSGAAALLQSALLQQGGRPARGVELKRALLSTATRLAGNDAVDQGAGVLNVSAAYRWLLGGHQTGVYRVRSLTDGANGSAGPAAFRRSGLGSPADTVQRFVVQSVGGQPAARLLLRADAPWLRAPRSVDLQGGPETIAVGYDPDGLSQPGLYVGTVWGRSATDTLGGPVIGLVNTIVVPHELDPPLKERRTLAAGRVQRYFLDVPPAAGGLEIGAALPDPREKATLYLFEPDGKPYRGGSSAAIGGKDSAGATLRVAAEDVVAGVYEAVVVAPPAAGVTFDFVAALPAVALPGRNRGESARVVNPGPRDLSVSLRADLAGAIRDTVVAGRGPRAVRLRVRAPAWASTLTVDVELSERLWQSITDFGVTVFDSSGQLLSESPMNYAFARQVVALDSVRRGRPLSIELFPAFAHLQAPDEWQARVIVVFGTDRPLPGGELALAVPAGAEAAGELPPPPSLEVPDGFAPLLRLTAEASAGPAATRNSPW